MQIKAVKACKVIGSFICGRCFRGFCPVCGRRTVFLETGPWLRDDLLCSCCWSIPRHRAIISKIRELYPDLKGLKVFEPSPSRPTLKKLSRECKGYVPTRYRTDSIPGSVIDGIQTEDLERLTFSDASFDVVITQDVLEHVLDPARAFREIMRVLKPRGKHIFTVPFYPLKDTEIRAVRRNGSVMHLLPPVYHQDPHDPKGALVLTEWGKDIATIIKSESGMDTEIFNMRDRNKGIDGGFFGSFCKHKRGITFPVSRYDTV